MCYSLQEINWRNQGREVLPSNLEQKGFAETVCKIVLIISMG